MKTILFLLAGTVLVFNVAVAQAISIPDPLDPAVLFIGNPPLSGTYLFGNEVQPISSTTLGILENGTGQPSLVDPAVLLILGVPNKTDATFTAPAITLSTGTGTIGGTNLFSGTWDTATGYAGMFNTANQDVYDFIGLVPSGNASNMFDKWQLADLAVNGIDASYFGIFVYSLTGTGMEGGVTIDVTFSSAIDKGTFAVAYGQDDTGDSFTTPFTETGLTTTNGGGGGGGSPVPEPSTLLLLGAGLVGVGFFGRRKLNK